METKRCGRCLVVLPTTCFHKASREKSGLQSWCKACRKTHKYEERKEYHRNRYHTQKTNYLDWFYKRKYGLSLLEVQALLKQQEYKCAICNLSQEMFVKGLAVDHDHETKQVRGLLCMECNTGLGKFKDNPDLLRKAIEYLER